MALGRPVVATRVGGLPGVIQEGRHGFIADRADPVALARQVVDLFADRGLRQDMREASRQRVRDRFGVQQMVRAIEAAYTDVLEMKGWTTADDAVGRRRA